jgi:hypothetical protein
LAGRHSRIKWKKRCLPCSPLIRVVARSSTETSTLFLKCTSSSLHLLHSLLHRPSQAPSRPVALRERKTKGVISSVFFYYTLVTTSSDFFLKITLKGGVSKDRYLSNLFKHLGVDDKITQSNWDSRVLHGFAARLSPLTLSLVRANPDVANIEEDGVFTVSVFPRRSDLSLLTVVFEPDTRHSNPSRFCYVNLLLESST